MDYFNDEIEEIINEQIKLANKMKKIAFPNNIKITDNLYKPKIPKMALDFQHLANSYQMKIHNQSPLKNIQKLNKKFYVPTPYFDNVVPFQKAVENLKRINNISLQDNLQNLVDQIGYPGKKLNGFQKSNIDFLNRSDEIKNLLSKEISYYSDNTSDINNIFESDIISNINFENSINGIPNVEKETTDQSNKSSSNEIQKETETSFHSSQILLWLSFLLSVNDKITNIREMPNNVNWIIDLIKQLIDLINKK